MSEAELYELGDYVDSIVNNNNNRVNKRDFLFDDWCIIYSDELWCLWCTIKEYNEINVLSFLDKMTYYTFCRMCYKNSTKF